MARGGVRIETDETLARWESGLKRIRVDDGARAVWQQAGEVYFARTQQYAHVEDGDMKRTGKRETEVMGKWVVNKVTYGGVAPSGRVVDYVGYETGRGGDHDFFTRARVATENMFKRTMGEATARLVQDAIQRG